MQNGRSKSVVDDRYQSFKFDLSKSMETAVNSCEEAVPKPGAVVFQTFLRRKLSLPAVASSVTKCVASFSPRAEVPQRGENGVFGRFAFQSITGSQVRLRWACNVQIAENSAKSNSNWGDCSLQPKRGSPEKDPLDPAEFRRLCSTPRLGSIKRRPPAFHQVLPCIDSSHDELNSLCADS